MKVLLIEDHPIVRAGCRRLLAERPGAQVIEAETGEAGLSTAATEQPDLVILDLNLPDTRGLDVLKVLRARADPPRVIVFSMYEEPAFVSAALDAGASAYVSKNDDPDALLDAMDAVGAGGTYLSRALAQKLALARISGTPAHPMDGLTERERELIGLLATGQSLAEVAAALGVSYRTTAELAARLRSRLSLRTNAALIRFAVEATRI